MGYLRDIITKGKISDSLSKITKGFSETVEEIVEETPQRRQEEEFAPMSTHQMVFGMYKATPIIKVAVKVGDKVYEESKLATPIDLDTDSVEVTPAPNSKAKIKVYVGSPNVHPLLG